MLLVKEKNTNLFNEALIQKNISLKDKNWFKTGGEAKYYSEPKSSQDFIDAIKFATNNRLSLFVIGQGANILVSDNGFDGLIIVPKLQNISHNTLDEQYFVKADCGVTFENLINYCLENQFIGLEEFSGIPGTVGGSVYINIHYFEFLLSNFLISANVIEKSSGKIINVNNDWFNFGYNTSTLQHKDYFLIDATFKVKKVNQLQAAYAKGRSDEIIRHRSKRYPIKGTCGSFFRNFHENEVSLESAGKKLIYVAYYLDKIGVKGSLKQGDAIVSYQHANMLINLANATSNDIINLAKQMQLLVKQHFNIIPQPECQLIGFQEYPLLK